MTPHQCFTSTLHKNWTKDREKHQHQLNLEHHIDIRLTLLVFLLWGMTYTGFLHQWNHTFFITIFTGLLCSLLLLLSATALIKKLQMFTPTIIAIAATLLLQLCLIQTNGTAHATQTYASLNGQPVRITGTVTRSKRLSTDNFLVEISSDTISSHGQKLTAQRKLTVFLKQAPNHGSSIELLGKIKTQGATITLENTHLNASSHHTPTSQNFKDSLATQLGTLLEENQAGLILGLSYGDDSLLAKPVRENFKISGLTHLTAVSGSNISLIFILVFRIGQHFHFPRPLLIVLGFSTTALYAIFVGWEGSVIRSWTMGGIGALALLLGHGKQIAAILSTCLVFLIFLFPELSYNLGFVLSALATASLIFLAPAISRLFSVFLPTPCADALAVPAAASLWCAPVLAFIQSELGTYTVFANLLAAPLVPPITLIGLFIALCHLTGFSSVLSFLAWPAGFLAHLLLDIAAFFARAPGGTLALENLPLGKIAVLLMAVCASLLIYIADYLLFTTAHQHSHARKVQL